VEFRSPAIHIRHGHFQHSRRADLEPFQIFRGSHRTAFRSRRIPEAQLPVCQ
ncbi:hypothetical protein BFDFBN_BFDFBN_15985, partial [Dysosmobacter welbionis]